MNYPIPLLNFFNSFSSLKTKLILFIWLKDPLDLCCRPFFVLIVHHYTIGVLVRPEIWSFPNTLCTSSLPAWAIPVHLKVWIQVSQAFPEMPENFNIFSSSLCTLANQSCYYILVAYMDWNIGGTISKNNEVRKICFIFVVLGVRFWKDI